MNAFAGDSTLVVKKKKAFNHYLSVNGTYFLQQYLNFNKSGTTITPSPYLVEYRFLYKNNGFRFSMGADLHQSKNFLDSSQITVSHNYGFSFRLGYVYQHQLVKHWSYFVGADIISHLTDTFSRVNTVEDIVATDSKAMMIGFGPSFGIQWDINKRIGIFTETMFDYRLQFEQNKVTSLNFNAIDSGTHATNNNLGFVIPVSIFFYVRL
jgi:hypothetical protein